MRKYNNLKGSCERTQQTKSSFDKIYKKSLRDNVIRKKEFF